MKLSCRCLGESNNPVLVLLHGFMGSTDDWRRLVQYLHTRFYLVLVDLPGHGDSKSANDLDFLLFAQSLESLLAKTVAAKVSLMGYSLGGRLAMAFAEQYPKRLNLLMLEGAHPGLQDKCEAKARRLSDQQWASRFHNEPLTDVLQDWYLQPVFKDLSEHQKQLLVDLRSRQSGADLADVMLAFSLSGQPDFRETLKQFDFPVYFFVGEKDDKFKALGQSLYQQKSINGLNVISDSGHNIHREQPEKLALSMIRLAETSGVFR